MGLLQCLLMKRLSNSTYKAERLQNGCYLRYHFFKGIKLNDCMLTLLVNSFSFSKAILLIVVSMHKRVASPSSKTNDYIYFPLDGELLVLTIILSANSPRLND